MQRRFAAIFCADIVGYSRLMEKDQKGAIALVRDLRDRRLEPELIARGGAVIKRMGDGWIAIFDAIEPAVESAKVIQLMLTADARLQLRVAVHVGEFFDDGVDYYGSGINIAARLLAEAPPSGVMISGEAHRQLDVQLAALFSDAGTFRLKNLVQPVSGWQWRPEKLGTPQRPQRDEIPVILIEPVASGDDQLLREAAADLQEQLLHRLSQRSGVRVVADHRHDGPSSRSTHRLRGNLRLQSDAAQIELSLLLSETMEVIWRQIHDGKASDIFELCDRSVLRAVDGLRLQINAYDGRRLVGLGDSELGSAQLRARAAYLMYRATIADQAHAARLLERAIELDPENATNLAMWAEAEFFRHLAMFELPNSELSGKLKAAADRAVQLAPRNDYVFYVRCNIRTRLLDDIGGARRDLGRLERINPGYALRHEVAGMVELRCGNWSSAASAFERAVEMSDDDPYLPLRLYGLAVARLLNDELEACINSITKAIGLRRDCRIYWRVLALAHEASGNAQSARPADHESDGSPNPPDMLAPLLPIPKSTAQYLMRLRAHRSNRR